MTTAAIYTLNEQVGIYIVADEGIFTITFAASIAKKIVEWGQNKN